MPIHGRRAKLTAVAMLAALLLTWSTSVSFAQLYEAVQQDAYRPTDSDANFNQVTTYRVRAANIPQPDFILMEPLNQEVRKLLIEDLQVMDNLLTRAIAGATGPEGLYRQALGVRVALAPDPDSRIRYIQGFGAIFTYHVNIPVAEQKKQETARTTKPKKPETEWERTRRLLFAPRPAREQTGYGMGGEMDASGGGFGSYGGGDGMEGYADIEISAQSAPYNADVVSSIREGVKDALKNVPQIRTLEGAEEELVLEGGFEADLSFENSPGSGFGSSSPAKLAEPANQHPKHRVIVILKSEIDGSVMTFTTSPEAWRGGRLEDAVTVSQFFAVKSRTPSGKAYAPRYAPPVKYPTPQVNPYAPTDSQNSNLSEPRSGYRPVPQSGTIYQDAGSYPSTVPEPDDSPNNPNRTTPEPIQDEGRYEPGTSSTTPPGSTREFPTPLSGPEQVNPEPVNSGPVTY